MIPRIIWQTWKSKALLPHVFDAWRRTFVDLNPNWECWLWDDTDNADFVAKHFPWFVTRYAEYPQPICRVDAVRYLFLYYYGGIYADLDTMCLRSLAPILEHRGVVLGSLGADPNFEHSIPNAVMASAPRQPFWLTVASLMLLCDDLTPRPEMITGPVMLKRAYDLATRQPDVAREHAASIAAMLPHDMQPAKNPGKIILLPSRTFYPMDWSDPIHQRYFRRPILNGVLPVPDISQLRELFPSSLTFTFWTHSWGDWPAPPILGH